MNPTFQIWEVGPRDGLQSLGATLTPKARAEFALALLASGLTHLELGSFVHPKLVPAMADSSKVFELVKQSAEGCFSAIVMNERGLREAIAAGASHASIVTIITEAFSLRNNRCSPETTITRAGALISLAKTFLSFHTTYLAALRIW